MEEFLKYGCYRFGNSTDRKFQKFFIQDKSRFKPNGVMLLKDYSKSLRFPTPIDESLLKRAELGEIIKDEQIMKIKEI